MTPTEKLRKGLKSAHVPYDEKRSSEHVTVVRTGTGHHITFFERINGTFDVYDLTPGQAITTAVMLA